MRGIGLLIPLFAIIGVVLLGIVGPWIAPVDPLRVALIDSYKPPSFMAGGVPAHILGTDALGRDILSRILFGARTTLVVSAASIVAAGVIGILAGLVAGYAGGIADVVIMRFADATIAFPIIFLGLLLAVTIGAGVPTVVVAIAAVLWARFARVTRGEVRTLRGREFVALARLGGCSSWRILLRHLLPNIANTLVVVATLQVGLVILTESSLSFLGAGVPPPTPTWGGMVADGRGDITDAWWISFFPGCAILVAVLASNLVGDWLRDVLDPKLRQI